MKDTNKHPTNEASTVAIISGSCDLPPSLKILALTTIIYTAAKKKLNQLLAQF